MEENSTNGTVTNEDLKKILEGAQTVDPMTMPFDQFAANMTAPIISQQTQELVTAVVVLQRRLEVCLQRIKRAEEK